MLTCQSNLFDLPENISYLNCAYMSPQLKSVTQVGLQTIQIKARPYETQVSDFFEPVEQLKQAFAKLINTPAPQRIALIPSVSYGIANVVKNITLKENEKIILVDEQFPSNYYSWQRLAEQHNAQIKTIVPPDGDDRAAGWNAAILSSIDETTKVVAISHTHWADGTLFDLLAIRKKTRQVGALLVIDGTQSVGALPFDVQTIQPDALICGGYKFLFGPYSLGLAFYNEYFDDGIPIEENWINRHNSEHFAGLVNYQPAYRPLANRYSVGEQSNFMLVPMLLHAIEQLLDWKVAAIQNYCNHIAQNAVEELKGIGCQIEKTTHRGGHLFGIRLPQHIDQNELQQAFKSNNVYVSQRGNAIRVSPHLYNHAGHFQQLVDCFKAAAVRQLV